MTGEWGGVYLHSGTGAMSHVTAGYLFGNEDYVRYNEHFIVRFHFSEKLLLELFLNHVSDLIAFNQTEYCVFLKLPPEGLLRLPQERQHP